MLLDDQTIRDIPDEVMDRSAISRGGLWKFAKCAWPEIEASPLVPGWHMEQVCNHLEAVSRGDCRRLIINIPPGTSKSTLTSVLWPAWDWINNPQRKWMFATFDASLAWRDALRCRQLVRSPWYASRWGTSVELDDSADSQATQSVYSTTAGGRRVSVTVGGRATGWHANFQVIDDPIKPKDIAGDPDQARSALERTWTWFTMTMASRREDPKKFARVIIMQRLHEDDLVGRILDTDKEHEWTHLMLPMRFEPERACITPYGGDVRERAGELLCSERFDEASVTELERDYGSQAAASQLQQRPTAPGGNLFKREWFRERWRALPADLAMVQSWDCAFKDTAKADFVAGHVWGYSKGKYYLVDRIHDRMGLPETVRCVEALTRRWPKARGKLIEDKANGPAVEQVLRDKMSGIIMITPEGGKVARANAISPLCEAGNIVLPDPAVHQWSDDVLEEIVSFPFSRNDDDVDCMTQAIVYLHDHTQAKYLEAMRKVASGQVKIR